MDLVRDGDPSGGMIRPIVYDPENPRIETTLLGPTNTLKLEPEAASLPMEIEVDTKHRVVRVDVSGTTTVLKVREWSDWIPLQLSPLFRIDYRESRRSWTHFLRFCDSGARELHLSLIQ